MSRLDELRAAIEDARHKTEAANAKVIGTARCIGERHDKGLPISVALVALLAADSREYRKQQAALMELHSAEIFTRAEAAKQFLTSTTMGG